VSNLIKIVLVGAEFLFAHRLIEGAAGTKVISPRHGKETA
jgi:hypothetical protein